MLARPTRRAFAAAATLAALGLALTACVSESERGATAAPTVAMPTPPGSTAAPTASPAATTTPSSPTDDDPGAPVDPADRPQATEIALPASCDELYSPELRAALEAQMPPLGDPGVTLESTRVEQARQILQSDVETVRCTWGRPSELGLATNVTIVTVEDAPRIQDVLAVGGLTCVDAAGGILCTRESDGSDSPEHPVAEGESHFLRGNGWVSTAWIGDLPEGYTEGIAAQLWG